MTDGYDRGKIFNLTLLAHSHAQAGNLDQACAVGLQAVTAGNGIQSHRVAKHLRDFRRAVPKAYTSEGLIRLDAALVPVINAA